MKLLATVEGRRLSWATRPSRWPSSIGSPRPPNWLLLRALYNFVKAGDKANSVTYALKLVGEYLKDQDRALGPALLGAASAVKLVAAKND